PVELGPGRGLTLDPHAAPPADVSSEDRLKRLEERFDTLLLELRELKGPSGGKLGTPPRKPNANFVASHPGQGAAVLKGPTGKPAKVPQAREVQLSRKEKPAPKTTARGEGDTETVALTRATYKLPPGKAQTVASFLTQSLSDEIEVRVKGDAL